jgi:hypothetical protein
VVIEEGLDPADKRRDEQITRPWPIRRRSAAPGPTCFRTGPKIRLRCHSPLSRLLDKMNAARLVFVTWGNADAALRGQCDALVRAFEEAGREAVE